VVADVDARDLALGENARICWRSSVGYIWFESITTDTRVERQRASAKTAPGSACGSIT
jgi:hypothetical protein